MFLHEKPQYERYVGVASRHARQVLELSSSGVSVSIDYNSRQRRDMDEPRFIRDSMRTDDI